MIACDESYDDVREIKKLTKDFEDGFNTRNIEKIMSFYADNYIDVNLSEPQQTYQERKDYYQKIVDKGEFTLKVNPTEIIISGDHAIARGDIILYFSDSEKSRQLRYMELWKRDNGKWKSIWGMDAELYK